MDCPICGDVAEEFSKISRYRSFCCPSCGDYEVSDTVYDTGMLQKLEPARRRSALEKAKRSATQDKRPKITSYTLEGI
jgi:anaerobic ribonucleoside-triphosphate reductase